MKFKWSKFFLYFFIVLFIPVIFIFMFVAAIIGDQRHPRRH